MKAKEISLEEKYDNLMERYAKLQGDNRILQEACISQAEIIRRLDIIGNMIGNYIKKEETEIIKQKRDRAQEEADMLSYDYNSRIVRYDNDYSCELRNRDTQEY